MSFEVAAYYNENDPFAAQWLRELVNAGAIAPGDVDERSIEDVKPDELAGYSQIHFFAGIGAWSYALRQAGWTDNRPIITASCPCQPFSQAGKGKGFADERHLWPALYHLIGQYTAEHGTPTIIGEQSASKAVEPWIDLIQADMEALGYAFGCIPPPASGVGAPHIRDRAYWVAHHPGNGRREECSDTGRGYAGDQAERQSTGLVPVGDVGGLDDTASPRHQRSEQNPKGQAWNEARLRLLGEGHGQAGHRPAGPTNGFWADADWLKCRDGRWRAVEPGTFPLVDGAANRVGRLRGYGNAINAEAARIWIETVMDSVDLRSAP